MKMQLCLNGTRQEILAQIDEARLVFATSLEAQPPAGAGKSGKDKKPPKEEKEPEADDPTPNEEATPDADNDDLGFDEPPPAKEKKKLKIEDVQIAFRDFAKGNDGKNREKAKKVLEKFKVKSVLDLKPEDFEKAIAALK